MPTQDNYTQRLGLAELDVYLETPENDTSYFNISNLPQIAGYGKHSFQISYNDPDDTDLLLKQNSGILFELVDANGETIFSELSDIPDASGAASAYFWIKKDPLWLAGEIADGPATLYIVGELDNVPEEFQGTYNIRTAFTFDIRKSQPNTSRILFYDVPALELSSSVNGQIQEFDRGSTTFARGYIEVSASHMQTHGGQVNFIELSYVESGSRTEEFTPLAEYPLIGSSSRYEVSESIDGLNPLSHVFITPVPRDFRRDSEVKFKLRFLDANKSPAKYYDEIKNDQVIEITSSFITVSGTPFVIEKEDNLLKGSMYTGNAVGKGFEQSGKSSAYLKTVDYQGFASASQGLAPGGVMFFSGSVLTSSGDNYDGVGLELFANTESFLRFRSDPSELDIRTNAFFVGSENTQFISASGGKIEISSSNFHLEPGGDVTMAGTIEAADGKIGGFHISESRINSENEKIILKSAGQISASSLLLASGSFVVDPDNLSRFGEDGFQSFVMVENTGVVIQTSNFNLNTARFIISSSDVGMMAVGSTPPTAHNSGKGFYVDGDGNLLIGNAAGPRIQFDGFDTIISSSNFFLGSGEQFVSGSLGNVEISSSNFHLDAEGNVNMAGTITATAGEIGGFSVSSDALSSTNFFISGAATNEELFISSSGFSVDATGIVSASALSLQGGDVGGLVVAEGTVSVGEILKLKDSGQITGSQVLFTGGKIASFNLSDDAFSTDSFFISSSATDDDMFISSSNFNVKASGDVTGSNVLFTGGKISGSNLTMEVPTFFLGSPSQFVSGSNGNIEITSSNFHLDRDGTVNMAGTITATSGKIAGWTITGDTLVGNNATLDGAGAALFRSDAGPDTDNGAAFDILRDEYYIDFSPADQGNTRNYYVKFGPNFAVDTSGILHASGAQFEGTISASKGIIGGFTTDGDAFRDNNNQIFISGSPAVGGTHHPRFMFISSSNFNVKQSGDITGSSALFNGNTTIGGTLDVTGTGTIASFVLDSSEIRSSNNNLRLKSSGNITGSQVLFTGGTIGGFDISSTQINSDNDNLIFKDSGQITASDAQIQGKITALSGTIGGFNIATDLDSTAGTLKLKGATGQITASDAQISGKVTATSGQIAGFTIDGNSLTATNFEIDASGKRITLGDAASTDLFVADADEGIQLGNNTFGLAPFSVTKAGVLKAVAGNIGGFGVSATTISSSNDNLILRNNGEITGSTVLFTGGKVGGFKITSTQITSSNLLFDSGNSKIVVGSANKITIQGGGTDNFITMGSKSAFAQSSTAGIIIGMDNNVPSLDLTRNANNYVRFDTSTGVDIKTDTFKLDTTTLDIDSSTSRIQVVNGSSNEVVRLGEISDSASDLFGLKVYDGSGTADANTLVKLGGEGNTIGGWTITNDQIVSDNLVIHSSGRLETADFASGVKGWRISSEGNGEAEFENAVIRGTLKTAVFEKETVNAVGGQLYIANSTALTGSGQISASFATMSVVNVSGFVEGEILSLKKVTETGFTTEYVKVESASRDDRSSDTNFAGQLFVTRSFGAGLTGASGSLGGSPGFAQSYEPGQVIVSTGKIGTGYIRLNANPNDQATPFMDIVERTGNGVYDIELKTRVGDLSGLSSATLFGNSNPGFGIFTENGFFKGGINATTGSFTGVVHINTSASEVMKLGTNVSGTDDGIFINNNNFLFTDGQFKTGNATNFISHDGSGDVQIASQNFELKGGSKLLLNTDSLAFDTSNASTATRTAGTGVFMSSSGDFRVGNSSGNRLTFTGTSLELVTSDLNIDTSTFDLSTDGTGKIALGATPPTSISSGIGFFVDGAGNFLAGNASGNFIRFNQSSGAVQVSGEITITAGDLAGVTKDSISGSVQSGLDDLEAGVSASIDSATGSLSSSLATAIGDVSSSAGQGISSANTATAAASTAQSAIDDMETQVVLNSGGMDLRNESNLNLVSYGTTTKFFDGVGQTDAHQKLRLNTDGVFAFANTTQSFARFFDEGVQIVSGGIERAKFAATTTIGNPSFEHVEITETTLKLKDGSTTRLSMDSSGMQIGSVSDGITLDASGNATFNGSITITAGDLPSGTVSGSAQLADAISGSVASVSSSIATNLAAASSSAGQGISSANTAATAATNAQNTADDANTAAGAASTLASNLAAGAEASASLAESNANALASGLAAGSEASASAAQAAAELLASNLAAGSRDSASAASSAASTAQNAIDTMETQVVLTSQGMSLRASNNPSDGALNGQDVVQFGTTTKFFDGVDDQDANRKLQLNADGIFAFGDDTNTFTRVNSKGVQLVKDSTDVGFFSEVVRVGALNAQHVSMSSAGVTFMNSATQTGKISGHGALIGKTNEAHISASTTEINVIKDSNNKAILGADGLIISQSGGGVGEFASTTRIGNRGTEHVEITSTSLKLKDATTDLVTVSGTTVTIGNDADNRVTITPTSMQIGSSTGGITMDSDGNATFKGTITVGSLPGGTVSGSAQLADAISGSVGEFSSSAASSIAGTANDSSSMAAAVQLTSTGLNVLDGSGNNLAQFGDTVTIGEDKDDNSRIFIDNNSVDLIVDSGGTDTVQASFGATTTIGSTSGEHVSISSDAVEIKTDANTTVLSASSAGLEMQGTVRANAGEIGGFELEPNAFTKTIDGGSNNYTASVKLSPDTGSHNSLLFRMRALRDNGNTTLYELVNTKPANDSFMIENFGRVQGNFRELGDFHDRSETKDLSGDVITTSIASGSFMQRIYFPQGGDSVLPGKVEQRLVSQESGSRSRIIQSVESLGLGQTHARLFFDGHTGAVSASNQIFTSTGNLAQTNPTPQHNGKGIVFDSFGAIGAPGEAIPGVFMGSTGSYFRYMGKDGADVLQISSSNFILDAGSLLTPKLEIEGKITATSGDIAGFEILPEGFRKTETLTGSVKKNITLSPSTGSVDLAMIKLSSIKAPKLNLFEVVQGRFATTPQQTIFGAFNGNNLNAGAHNDAVWDDIDYLHSTIPEQRDFSNVTGSYIKIINDADNAQSPSSTFRVIAQNVGLSPSVNIDAGPSTFATGNSVKSSMYIGGYEGAISSSFQGLAYGTGKGVVSDALVFGGESVPGFFAGLARNGNNMQSFIAYSGRDSENGMKIILGNHLDIQHSPGTAANDIPGHFSFNLSGSFSGTNDSHAGNIDIHGVDSGSIRQLKTSVIEVVEPVGADDVPWNALQGPLKQSGKGPGARGWHYQTFNHNFADTVTTTEHFLPWQGSAEQTAAQTDSRPETLFLAPFDMELQRVMVRINNVSDGTQNFGVKLYKIDNGDDTLDQVAEADHAPTIVADTMFHISRSQFTQYDMDEEAPPDISAGDLCALSIDPNGTISSTSNGNVYITSVWKIKFDGDERGQGN